VDNVERVALSPEVRAPYCDAGVPTCDGDQSIEPKRLRPSPKGVKGGHGIEPLGMSLVPPESCRSCCAGEIFCPVPEETSQKLPGMLCVPLCSLLIGIGDPEDGALIKGPSHDLQTNGHAVARKTARNGDRRKTGQIEWHGVAAARYRQGYVVFARFAGRKWRGGHYQRVVPLHRFVESLHDDMPRALRLQVLHGRKHAPHLQHTAQVVAQQLGLGKRM
jgi:hypothetical protein